MRPEQEPIVLMSQYYIEEPHQVVDDKLLQEIQEFYNKQVSNNKDEFKRRFGFSVSNSYKAELPFLQDIYQPGYALEYVAVARSEDNRKDIVGVAELVEKDLDRYNFALHPFKKAYEINWFTNQQHDRLSQELIITLAMFGCSRGITELYFSCGQSDTTMESIVHAVGKSLKGEVHPHTDYINQQREYLLLLPPLLPQQFSSTFI